MQKIVSLITAFSVTLISLVGGIDDLLSILFLIMISDYVTGVFVAFKRKELNSSIGFIGIMKKIVMLIIIAISYSFDSRLFHTEVLRTAVIIFYLCNETLSVIENVSELGVPIPDKLKETLNQLNGKEK